MTQGLCQFKPRHLSLLCFQKDMEKIENDHVHLFSYLEKLDFSYFVFDVAAFSNIITQAPNPQIRETNSVLLSLDFASFL